jgi:hypothetical protein
VCTHTVERSSRAATGQPWRKADTLRFEVALVGGRELYGLPGARAFDERPLAEIVGRGTITTGQFGGLARQVFLDSVARFTFDGETEENGRRAFVYRYDVPPEKSRYRLRSGNRDAVVGFQGEFRIDAETLDLLRLEVQAYDIPEPLSLAEADTTLRYERVAIGGEEALLPVAATFRVAGVDGIEDLNHTRLSGCRRYRVESTVRADGEIEAVRPAKPERAIAEQPPELPAGAVLELALESDFDPQAASVGDPVRARVVRPLKDGETIVVPEGAPVLGRVVRLEQETIPFPIYEIGLQFDTLQIGGADRPIVATLEQAGSIRRSRVAAASGWTSWCARRSPVRGSCIGTHGDCRSRGACA